MANESKTGLVAQADLTTGSPTNKQKIARVRALIPDPDGATAGANTTARLGFYDEISPTLAAQLHVELTALESSVTNA